MLPMEYSKIETERQFKNISIKVRRHGLMGWLYHTYTAM